MRCSRNTREASLLLVDEAHSDAGGQLEGSPPALSQRAKLPPRHGIDVRSASLEREHARRRDLSQRPESGIALHVFEEQQSGSGWIVGRCGGGRRTERRPCCAQRVPAPPERVPRAHQPSFGHGASFRHGATRGLCGADTASRFAAAHGTPRTSCHHHLRNPSTHHHGRCVPYAPHHAHAC
jgi:hypothetical protein